MDFVTNITAMYNLNQVRQNLLEGSRTTEHIATAKQVNRGADNPSGLAMVKSMFSRTSGLRTSLDNTQFGISFLQQRDAALAEVGDILLRLKELAVRACNEATLTTSDRQKMTDEAASLISLMDNLNKDTRFNDRKVFDRSFDIVPGGTGALTFYDGGKVEISIDLASIYQSTGSPVTLRAAWFDGFAFFPDMNLMSPDGTEAFGWLYGLWSKPPGINVEGYLDQDTPEAEVLKGDADLHGLGNMDSADSIKYSGWDPGMNAQGYFEEYFIIDNPAEGLWKIIIDNEDVQDRLYGIFVNEPSKEPTEAQDIVQVGPDNEDNYRMRLTMYEVDSLSLGVSASFSTTEDAQKSLSSIDDALEQLNEYRAEDGVRMRRLMHIADEGNREVINLEAARSRIEDADMASEFTDMTRQQILDHTMSQAAIFAGRSPMYVLDLIDAARNTAVAGE